MSVDELQSALRASRDRLFAALSGLSEEQFRFVPGGGAWNIATHLAHLLRCERMWAERVATAFITDGIAVPSSGTTNDDEPGLAQRLAVPQIIHGMQASRRDLEEALQRPEAVLDRAIMHEVRGRMTVEDMARKVLEHESEHADAIEGIARQAMASRRVTIPITPRS